VKFVLADRADYEWMRDVIRERGLGALGSTLLASPVWGRLSSKDLVGWVLADALPVRVNIQLHKIIWGSDAQGV
jgi:7-carboxy-7-deazaguanine synthase